MEIEQLTLFNLKQLTELVLELWSDCSFDEEFETYQNVISSKNEICFLCKSQDAYIGFIHLSTRNDYVEGANTSPVAYIEGIYVKPDYQQKGIAKLLVSNAQNWAKQNGFTQLASDTYIHNEASVEFHRKIGFEEVNRIVCFIKDL